MLWQLLGSYLLGAQGQRRVPMMQRFSCAVSQNCPVKDNGAFAWNDGRR